MGEPQGPEDGKTDGLETPLRLVVASTWDGEPLPADGQARIDVVRDGALLTASIDAPFAGDPPPPHAAGSTWELWEHEVVELFLVSSDERYVELEWGPHGHHLALRLHGRRTIVEKHLPLTYEATLTGGRWQGSATIAIAELCLPVTHVNAFAIRGVGDRRRYMAAYPLGTAAPDFHALEGYPSVRQASGAPSPPATSSAST